MFAGNIPEFIIPTIVVWLALSLNRVLFIFPVSLIVPMILKFNSYPRPIMYRSGRSRLKRLFNVAGTTYNRGGI